MNYQYYCRICSGNKYLTIVDNIRDWEYGFNGSYESRKCLRCSSVQIHPFPEIQDLIEAYKVDYHGFAAPAEKGALYSFLFKIIERITGREINKVLHKNSHVLDVGCGIGLFLNKLRALGYYNIEGIDFSEKAVAVVKKNGIKCHLGTFLDLTKEEKSYDLIVMNNYLEHTLNPLKELMKARSLLKDNGLLIGELPNFDSCDRLLFGRYWGGNHVPRHTFQFDSELLSSLMGQAGFKTTKILYPLNTSHFALSIQNAFQRNRRDLRNNEKLVHGRNRYYSLYMIGLVPINIICVLLKKTGFMRFHATP